MTPFTQQFVKKAGFLLALIPVLFMFSCGPGPIDKAEYGWFDFVISDLDTSINAVDLSFLNEDVAGANGFVTIDDGHFINGSGQKVRFFGTNLTFDNCFPEKETATKIAARLRKMGMNVVRFHHMDMNATPRGIWDSSMTALDPDQLDKLDWLIYQLKKHGVYANINLHVSRTYPGLETEVPQFRFGKTLDYFYRPYIDFQKNYAKMLLTHENAYTGKAYINEPAVAFIELNNENSLLSSWKLLPQAPDDIKNSILSQWKTWLRANSPNSGQMNLFGIIEGYEDASAIQKELLWRFLVDTEMNYAKEMTDYVKNELHAVPLITDTQASYSGVAGVQREATCSDFIDMHAYWEHPRFPGESWSRTDWLIRNTSMVSDKNAGTLSRFSQHRVEGMPLTISEYDHPAPNFYCAEMYPILNAVAAFQDWDGIYHFTFNGRYDEGKIQGFFSSAGHPLKQLFIPVGSVLFRMSAVDTGIEKVQLYLPENKIIDELTEFGDHLRLHGSNMNYIWEKAGAPKALPLLHPFEVSFQGDEVALSKPVDEPEGDWISDTKELCWNNRDSLQSVFTINAENAKAAVGYIGGKTIDLGDVTIAMDTTEFNWATIALTSMDGKPLTTSSSVLLVAAGRMENSNMQWNESKTSVGAEWGNKPTRAEGIPATISFKDMGSFRAFVLDPNGNQGNEVKVFERDGQQLLVIGSQHRTLWYILKR